MLIEVIYNPLCALASCRVNNDLMDGTLPAPDNRFLN